MFWIFIFLLFNSVVTDDSMEKFKSCNNEACILIQCYFPVSEFLTATQNEIKLFEDFIELNHVFVSYHLCNDLSADNIDEVGACIYGVLFKLYQFDANLTIHQRMHVHQAQIQEESIAIVIDMISAILYRVQSIDDTNQLEDFIQKSNKEEDVVVINAQSLTPKVHLDISRIILNYGQWFTFIYSTNINNRKTICSYDIYPMGNDLTLLICGMEDNIQIILEQQIAMKNTRSATIKRFSDLTYINVFQRTLPTLFYIYDNSTFTLIINKNIIIIPVNILNFKTIDIENHMFLHGPYPFYLYWSPKKNIFQRLGDHPSDELINILLNEEQENDLKNMYGMFDDEVRYISENCCSEIEINPNVHFLKTSNDYYTYREKYPKSAILFTVKWDSTSKLARKTFHSLSSRLNNYLPMIDIDCFDWTDICNDENIYQWPTLSLTDLTTNKIYQGSTNENEMALNLFRFSVSQPYEITNDSNKILAESLLIDQQVIVLARIQYEEKSLYDTYKKLVDMFVNNEHIFFMFQYSTESSCLIIKQKYGDIKSLFEPKTTIYPLNEDLDDLQTLIINALQISLIPFNPIDFIKSTSSFFIAASHTQLVQLDNLPAEIPLVWIDTNSPWILTINQYGHITYPAIIYINYSTGYVYVNSTLTDITTWVKAVQMELMTPSYELSSDEKPLQKEIDFNKQIVDEELLNEYSLIHQESEKINEHGIGFDMNGLPIGIIS
ncbi:unnamed protein product [Adineta steineri]|uniref:Thioredoxin domain-containing protein n=2 Tax=Adineta steineri TaxID=433720 RepID=A0A818R6K1_9BILA|nr:unnamed protein product [Adineta steineri]